MSVSNMVWFICFVVEAKNAFENCQRIGISCLSKTKEDAIIEANAAMKARGHCVGEPYDAFQYEENEQ